LFNPILPTGSVAADEWTEDLQFLYARGVQTIMPPNP
jgi:hypothetical protein